MNTLVEWDKIERQIDEAKDLKAIISMQEQVEAIKILVKQTDGSLKAQNKCSRYRIFLEQKAGEFYREMPDETGKRTDLTSSTEFTKSDKQNIVKEVGKTRTTFSKWAKESDIPKEKVIEYENKCNEEGKELTSAGLLNFTNIEKNIHFSSKSKEWTTPQIIIDKTIQLFGEIDLDPCSNPDFPNIPAQRHFEKKEDGLSRDWFGRIYMNPPYGSEIKKWIFYLAEQFEGGNVNEAIALVPSRTDTEWFRRLKAYLRCFIWGRLRFGVGENSAPFPSMVVYLGTNIEGFVQVFIDIGDIYGPYGQK